MFLLVHGERGGGTEVVVTDGDKMIVNECTSNTLLFFQTRAEIKPPSSGGGYTHTTSCITVEETSGIPLDTMYVLASTHTRTPFSRARSARPSVEREMSFGGINNKKRVLASVARCEHNLSTNYVCVACM